MASARFLTEKKNKRQQYDQKNKIMDHGGLGQKKISQRIKTPEI